MHGLFDTSKHCEMSLAVISDTRSMCAHDFQLIKANLKRRNTTLHGLSYLRRNEDLRERALLKL